MVLALLEADGFVYRVRGAYLHTVCGQPVRESGADVVCERCRVEIRPRIARAGPPKAQAAQPLVCGHCGKTIGASVLRGPDLIRAIKAHNCPEAVRA